MKAIGSVIANGVLACMAVIVAAGPAAAAGADAPGASAEASSQAQDRDHRGEGERHDGWRRDGDRQEGWQQGGWHHHHGHAGMFRALGLTDAQRASMKSILEAAQPAMRDLHEKLHANFKLLRETAPDDKTYAQLAARVSQENGALTAKLISARSKLYSQCYALLAPVQKTHLAELQVKRAKWTDERSQQMRDGHRPRPDGAMDNSAQLSPPST